MERVIFEVIKEIFDINFDFEVVLSRPEPKFGDYATNIAMQLAKKLGQNPRQIAEKIAEKLREAEDFSEVTIAGPGFINIRLSDSALIRQVYTRPAKPRSGQQVVIETNNPNPFKPMHIGHAYNAILADTMANLLAVSGADVKRVSYHGDVGAHVGKIMWALLRYCDGDTSKLDEIPVDQRNDFMGEMYAEGAKIAKEDESAKAEIDELAKQSFTRQDPLYAKIYDTVFDWSFEQIDSVLARIGNVPIEKRYLESVADVRGVKTVKENVPNVFIESDGALIFEGSKHGSFDNVFVATVYVSQTKMHIAQSMNAIPDIGMTGEALMAQLTDPQVARADVLATLPAQAAEKAKEIILHFDKLAVAINTGTNIPSVATPNGQAAFLFLLTSALAPVIRLSYGRMVLLALPYTITMSITGALAVYYFL
ncbi:arginine--tRNA ligase [Candidatus Saccharibacteria bacterium]|nr:MAG: arginine--tRNA ligase [Candidatus Saccharibacteria bacterium]